MSLAVLLLATIVHVTRDGVSVPAEVCRFAARDAREPVARWLSPGDVVCSSASTETSFPKGVWNVYARSGTDFLSRTTVLVDGSKPPDRLDLALVAAVPVNAKEPVVVHVRGSSIRHAMAPRDEPALAIEMKDGKPLSVNGAPRALITGIQYEGDVPKGAPAIEVITATRTIRPLIAPDRQHLDGSLLAFENVPSGDAVLRIGGAGWKRQTVPLKIGDGVTVGPTVTIAPASTMLVEWNALVELATLQQAAGPASCAVVPVTTDFRAEVFACPGLQPSQAETFDTTTCRIVHRAVLDGTQQSGRFEVDDLDPGTYLAELTYGTLPRLRRAATLSRFETKTVSLSFAFSSLFGHVTIGGRELSSSVTLRFSSGSAVTNADGDYSVVLRTPLVRDQMIRVKSCDGKLQSAFPIEREVLANARFDIDIPAHTLMLEVVDAHTQVPLDKAWVRFGAITESGSFLFNQRLTDENGKTFFSEKDGKIVIENLPGGNTIKAFINRDGYEQAEIEPFKFDSENEKHVRVPMTAKAFRGRIVSALPFEAGQIYWYSMGGRETERTDMQPDGTFAYGRSHGTDETLTVVSVNQPLWTTSMPLLVERSSLELTIPAAPVRQFEIAVVPGFPQQSATIGLQIGAWVVPANALNQHLALRGLPFRMTDGAPIAVRDILATGPLIAILGPPLNELPPGWQQLNLFALPQFAGLPRKAVPDNGRVTFGE